MSGNINIVFKSESIGVCLAAKLRNKFMSLPLDIAFGVVLSPLSLQNLILSLLPLDVVYKELSLIFVPSIETV